MTNKSHESLSAMMDNEADDLELRRILRELESSANADASTEMKAKWQRYHLISASLKQDIHSSPSCNLLSRIQEELANEQVPVASPLSSNHSGTGKGVLKFIGQGAIAASVALAVLFTADLAMDAGPGAETGTDAQIAENTNGQIPGLTGELNPSTRTQIAIQNGLDAEEMNRLQQVVSEELEDTLLLREIPATFVPEESP